MDISKCIKLISDRGDIGDLTRLAVKLNHLMKLEEEAIANNTNKFIEKYEELIYNGGISFGFIKGNQPSIYHSCIILNQLIDLDLTGAKIFETIRNWIFSRYTDKGWWINVSELGKDINLEVWEDDSDISVRIFHTALVLGTLSKLQLSSNEIHKYQNSYRILNNHMLTNQLLIGFQQSSWLVTLAMKYLDVDHDELKDHIRMITKYLDSGKDIKNIILLMEVLIETGLESSDPLIIRGKQKIMDQYVEEEYYAGWKINDQFDPGVTLAGLIILTNN
jgi:hypothetical protein